MQVTYLNIPQASAKFFEAKRHRSGVFGLADHWLRAAAAVKGRMRICIPAPETSSGERPVHVPRVSQAAFTGILRWVGGLVQQSARVLWLPSCSSAPQLEMLLPEAAEVRTLCTSAPPRAASLSASCG